MHEVEWVVDKGGRWCYLYVFCWVHEYLSEGSFFPGQKELVGERYEGWSLEVYHASFFVKNCVKDGYVAVAYEDFGVLFQGIPLHVLEYVVAVESSPETNYTVYLFVLERVMSIFSRLMGGPAVPF